MKRWRRRLVLFAVLLLVGAVVNVAVAWVLTLRGQPQRRGSDGVPKYHFPFSAFGSQPAADDEREVTPMQLRTFGITVSFETTAWNAVGTYAFGWPLRSMAMGRYVGMDGEREIFMLRLSSPRRAGEPFDVSGALPLRPLPSGFVINTVVYAAVIGSCIASVTTLRRRLRARGGRCPKCGYDLAGLAAGADPCPECGATP